MAAPGIKIQSVPEHQADHKWPTARHKSKPVAIWGECQLIPKI